MSERIRWRKPDDHIFAAAEDFLTLHFRPAQAHSLAEALGRAPTRRFKAKDIIRASGLPVLPADSKHVARKLERADEGEAWDPIMLVRGLPLLIADGYHKTCAAYWLDEDTEVEARIV